MILLLLFKNYNLFLLLFLILLLLFIIYIMFKIIKKLLTFTYNIPLSALSK